MTKSWFPLRSCLCVVSSLLIISGIGLIILAPHLLEITKKNYMVLRSNSHVYDIWKRFPFAVPMDFYFFNWTNPEDVYNETVKPKFQEVGPYRFLEDQMKSDVRWNDNGTVTFKQLKLWYYRDEEDNGNLDDEVTTVNPVALATVHVARTWNYWVRRGLSMALSKVVPTITITRTVRQMLFEGYPDVVIKMANTLPFLADQKPPSWDKFGWFYMRNGSHDFEGVYNMGTGINSTLGRLYQWNYKKKTPYYQGECAEVGGSAGEIFEPGQNTVRLFSSDLCRTLVLKYVEKTIVENIVGYKYTAEDYMLDNGTVYQQNKCFCNGKCLPSGVVNVSSCRYGSPSFGSLPHFYNADPYYVSLLEGLQPDKNKHEFFVTLEPTTGVPLEVNARLQINLLLQPYPEFSMYEKAPRVFVPMLWFQQKMKIPPDEAFRIKLLLCIPTLSIVLGILMIFFGLSLASYVFYTRYSAILIKKRKNSTYLPHEVTPLNHCQSEIIR